MTLSQDNANSAVLKDFGNEWGYFDQAQLNPAERANIFDAYFELFPWNRLPAGGGRGADIGCGSGRWALLASQRVGHLALVDGSEEAIGVARRNLSARPNVSFHQATVGALPFDDSSLDFAYSLGVLHHVPDTQAAIYEIARTLKNGAPFLAYIYYRFDNRSWMFRALWRMSDILRMGICRLPFKLKRWVCELAAAFIYWPLGRFALLVEKMGLPAQYLPLYLYRNRSFYVMRTDALDRFGTKHEQRFTREEMHEMFENAGFKDIQFSSTAAYWCVLGIRSSGPKS